MVKSIMMKKLLHAPLKNTLASRRECKNYSLFMTKMPSLVHRSVKWLSVLNTLLFPVYFCTGKDWLSMDWCYNDTAAARRMDPSLSTTCSWVFPYKRRPLDKLGRGHESKLQIILIWYINSVEKQGHVLVTMGKFAFPSFQYTAACNRFLWKIK